MALVGIQCATVIDQYCYYYWFPDKEQYKHLIATKEKKNPEQSGDGTSVI